jgi:hypothetical protein
MPSPILTMNHKSIRIPSFINYQCFLNLFKIDLVYQLVSLIKILNSYYFFRFQNFLLICFYLLFIQIIVFVSVHYLKYFFRKILASHLTLLRFSFFFEFMAQILNFNHLYIFISLQLFFHNFLFNSAHFIILIINEFFYFILNSFIMQDNNHFYYFGKEMQS